MKKYRFITIKSEDGGGWFVHVNDGHHLWGQIGYDPIWKEHVFWPEDNTTWSVSWLRDVIDFIENEIDT